MLYVRRASVVEGHVERLELGLSLMEQWLCKQSGRQIHKVTISMTECMAARLELHVHGADVVVGSPVPRNMEPGSTRGNREVLKKSAVS